MGKGVKGMCEYVLGVGIRVLSSTSLLRRQNGSVSYGYGMKIQKNMLCSKGV